MPARAAKADAAEMAMPAPTAQAVSTEATGQRVALAEPAGSAPAGMPGLLRRPAMVTSRYLRSMSRRSAKAATAVLAETAAPAAGPTEEPAGTAVLAESVAQAARVMEAS